jgi:16S rRNA (guanine(1405)-N(7))-methyltransferase
MNNKTSASSAPSAVKINDRIINEILASKKYRDLGIPLETVRDLLEQELAAARSEKEAIKAVRRKLHNIVAPYLGDPAYLDAAHQIDAAFDPGDPAAVKAACTRILSAHASTRERLPHLEEFYARIFARTGLPGAILDLACGLNPLAFPWMGLPASVQYSAFDIHTPRVALINHYFTRQGLQPLTAVQDVIVSPPQMKAPVAFFFKEAHRFEQRQRGVNRLFWQALDVRWLVVTLPAASLSGRHDKSDQHRRLVYNTIAGLPWQVTEDQAGDEMIFWIEKGDGSTGNG